MANPEAVHYARLGTRALSSWMEEHGVDYLDLSGADLRGAKLRWSVLTGAFLEGADFTGADLSGCYFGPRTFSDSNPHVARHNIPTYVEGAKFAGASLLAATFNFVKLDKCIFTGSYLGLANFRNCTFSQTDVSESILVKTAFLSCNFSGVVGLKFTRHRGPSHIDMESVNLSEQLDSTFLRQTGMTTNQIDSLQIANRHESPTSFHSCFLSHATTDRAFCDRLYDALVRNGVRTWYAPEDIRGGSQIAPQLARAINIHDKTILVISEASIASQWVLNEITWAVDRQKASGLKTLFPISIVSFEKLKQWVAIDADTGLDLAKHVRSYFIPDFSNWSDTLSFENAVKRLLRDLQANDLGSSDAP